MPAQHNGIVMDLIEPRSRATSFLYLKLTGQQGVRGGTRMPQGGPYFTAEQLERIGLYIDALPL